MHQLILTITGKENVGIVASAMKVFEAMSHYYNKILSEGTPE
jgi:predicted amino acid-binding ACT domain protein